MRTAVSGDGDAADDLRGDGARAAFDIEADLGLAVGGIGTVAGEAVVGEDGADIAIEGDGRFGGRR